MKVINIKLTNREVTLLKTYCNAFAFEIDEDSSDYKFELELIFEKIKEALK